MRIHHGFKKTTGLTVPNNIMVKLPKYIGATFIALGVVSCASFAPQIAKDIAQPNNRPVRNFTSFSKSLQCMDNLLAQNKAPRVLVSSTVISDKSRRINVGADEMLLNAINHMNVKSGRYVFLDQSLEKEVGQLELLSPTEDRKIPNYYFRGAVTQVDTDIANDSANIGLDFTNAPNPLTINGGALQQISPNIKSGVSIVSVDLHLVSYPDKTVLRGGSVANSMVVTNRNLGIGASGFINLTGYNLTLSFQRVESIGQAVRNLIELGVIELLGRHANVPYWQCLNIEPTNEKLNNTKSTVFRAKSDRTNISEAQRMLAVLGYYNFKPTGIMDRQTHVALAKYQADNRLIATGDLNNDVYQNLVQDIDGYPANGRRLAQSKPAPTTLYKAPSKAKTLGKYLSLTTSAQTPKLGETLSINIRSKKNGFITCYHQSGAGKVTQILPVDPNTRYPVSAGFERKLPLKDDGFALKFETAGINERIGCLLRDVDQGHMPPFSKQEKPFAPLPIKKLEDIPKQIGSISDWVIISRTAS